MNLNTHAHTVRGLLGVVSHHTLLYEELTADENLRFYARLYGVTDADARIDEVLIQVGLGRKRRHDPVRTFSRGMKQRLAIGRAILHQPPVMLLDEPHTGLDREAAAMLDEVLRNITSGGRTVLMTTHDLNRSLALADRVAILSGGKIAHEAGTSDLVGTNFSELYNLIVHGY
jgi:ABC-type multidrug transport system ATPase subunit